MPMGGSKFAEAYVLIGTKIDKQDFGKAKGTITSKIGAIGKTAGAILGKGIMAGAGAAMAAGAGFAAIVKSQLGAIDDIAKTSDKLGLTTEALIGLHHAAELTGVGAKTLDMAVQRMTRRIAEAARGSGEAKSALRELGLDAQALSKMTPDQALGEIAGAMGRVESQADKVRLAFKLFDSEGVALVNTLNLGKDGLAEVAAEADRLGATFSRVDAAQVEAANDAIQRAKTAWAGFFAQATVDLAPFIELVSTDLTNAASDATAAGKDAGDAWGWAGKTAAVVSDTIAAWSAGFGYLQAMVTDVVALFAEVNATALEFRATVAGFAGISYFDDAATSARAFADSMRSAADQQFKDALKPFLDKMPSERARDLANRMNDVEDGANDAADAVAGIDKETMDAVDAAEKLAQKYAEQIAAKGKGGREAELAKLTYVLEQAKRQAEETGRAIEGIGGASVAKKPAVYDVYDDEPAETTPVATGFEAAEAAIENARKLSAELDKLEKHAKQVEVLADIQRQIDTFGKTDMEIKILDAEKSGNKEFADKMRAAAAEMNRLEKQAERTELAKELIGDTRTPIENFKKRVQELYELRDGGLVDDETLSRAIAAAKNETAQAIASEHPEMKVRLTGLADYHSQMQQALGRQSPKAKQQMEMLHKMEQMERVKTPETSIPATGDIATDNQFAQEVAVIHSIQNAGRKGADASDVAGEGKEQVALLRRVAGSLEEIAKRGRGKRSGRHAKGTGLEPA